MDRRGNAIHYGSKGSLDGRNKDNREIVDTTTTATPGPASWNPCRARHRHLKAAIHDRNRVRPTQGLVTYRNAI